MSVQCKNCSRCSVITRTCSMYYNQRLRMPLNVNITRQRVCTYFIRRQTKTERKWLDDAEKNISLFTETKTEKI